MLPRSYWKGWTASTVSNIGDGVVLVAVPLLAADMTRAPLAVAVTTVAVRLPWLIFGLLAGVIVDRADRRRMMIGTDIARAAGFAGVAVLVAADQMTLALLYISVFAMGVLETLFDTAAMSIVPSLVDGAQLEKANGRLFSAQIAANAFAGPALGGALFAAALWLPYGFDAFTFLVSAGLVAAVSGRFRPRRAGRSSMAEDVRAGMAFVWRERVIRTFAIGAGVLNFGFTAAAAVFVLHAQDNLGLGDAGYGLLLASAAVGGVSGAQAAPLVIAHLGRYRSLVVAVMAMAAGVAVMGAVSNPWPAAAGLSLLAFFEEVWNVISVTYRQARTPDEMLGRVMSSFRVIAYGTFPLGALAGGVAAEVLGLRAVFALGALVMAALVPVVVATMSEKALASR